MMHYSDDLVRVATGTLVEIRAWGDVLQYSGIKYQVVGDNLIAGLGLAHPNPVELWVNRADVVAAKLAMSDRFQNSLDDTPPY